VSQSPYISPRGPNNDRRRSQARMRGLVLLIVVIVVIVVVILVVTRPGGKSASSTTSTTSSDTSTTATTVTGTGDGSDTTETTAGTTGTTTYTADVTGGNEVPALDTAASGTLTITVDADGSMTFSFKVDSIISLTVAKLHQGKIGATGATIFTVYPGPTKDGLHSGTVAEGSIKASKLVGPLKGKSLDDLIAMIESGDVYLNVGTTSHPNGEIRGQLQ
jgi:hypothetical protein